MKIPLQHLKYLICQLQALKVFLEGQDLLNQLKFYLKNYDKKNKLSKYIKYR